MSEMPRQTAPRGSALPLALALALLVPLLAGLASTTSPASSAVLSTSSASTVATPKTDGAFRFRGVIEGFYREPWPREDRMHLLRWMAAQGMNLYIHAPKFDPYQRLRWREPYPGKAMHQFEREIGAARPRGLSWVPSISPGLPIVGAWERKEDICFSCPADRKVLYRKLNQFWELGVRTFTISFDDVIKTSSHPEDAAAYGVGDYAYGQANADLLNAVLQHYRKRDPRFRLITVPADYSGTTTTPYLEGLRSALHRDVIVMWTGTDVVSRTITCDSARKFGAAIGRTPLLWDNFPVNDYDAQKLMLGPYDGRAPDLPECLLGIVANPANQARTNKLPLYTVAEYLRAPARYHPERSWRKSLVDFAGAQAPLLRNFATNVRSTALNRIESASLEQRTEAFVTGLSRPNWPVAHRRLASLLLDYAGTPARMRKHFHDQRFVAEIDEGSAGSWLARLGFGARNGLQATRYLAATRPHIRAQFRNGVLTGRVVAPMDAGQAGAAQTAVAGMLARDDGNPANVYGDRVFTPPSAVPVTPYVNENRMDWYYQSAATFLSEYTAVAAAASNSVTLRVNGQQVPLKPDGSFTVRTRSAPVVAVATDGAGHKTSISYR